MATPAEPARNKPSTRLITAVARDAGVSADSVATVPWWSYTKTVLAAAALVLVRQERLRLDELLPGKPFTLRHLLQHRAGLPDYGSLPGYHAAVAASETPWPAGEMLRRAGADGLIFPPGEGWGYSNIGYFLVRELIEHAVGAPLGLSLDKLVLAPLGIANAAIACEPADLDTTAWGNKGRYHPGWVYHGLLIGPAGSAALLLHRLLSGGLLPAFLLDAMCSPHPVGGPVAGRPWQSAGYGLGLMSGFGRPPGRYVGHTGGGPGSSAAVYQEMSNGENGRPRCTAATFGHVDDLAVVEECAFTLASRA